MNSHLHPIFRQALAPFSPIDADNVKLGHALRESANDEHRICREHNGKAGLASAHRMVCSCGFIGQWREESDDYKYTNLQADERAHQWMVERSEVTR